LSGPFLLPKINHYRPIDTPTSLIYPETNIARIEIQPVRLRIDLSNLFNKVDYKNSGDPKYAN
jgi:hypothetical protein